MHSIFYKHDIFNNISIIHPLMLAIIKIQKYIDSHPRKMEKHLYVVQRTMNHTYVPLRNNSINTPACMVNLTCLQFGQNVLHSSHMQGASV